MRRIVETNLVSSAGRLDKLPVPSLPEVAFAGRSNVGKSSLLNALTGRRGLFKVSQTPGRTRTIVHVETRLDDESRIFLVDLPGYGYAKVARGAKRAWADLMDAYLGDRQTLHLVVVLVDVRRGPDQEEADLLDFLAEVGVPAILVATKLDRVPRSKQKAAIDKLQKDVGVKVMGVSAATKVGLDKVLSKITQSCGIF